MINKSQYTEHSFVPNNLITVTDTTLVLYGRTHADRITQFPLVFINLKPENLYACRHVENIINEILIS